MSAAADSLRELAALLRADRSVVSPHVVDSPPAEPVLGMLAAAGPRTSAAGREYALVIEAVREGYLLHYEPQRVRVVSGVDADLALLAGDYLYAVGLERLAAIGDLEAVRELSDLISLAAQVHDGGRGADRVALEAPALWLAAGTAVAAGAGVAHESAKAELRNDHAGAAAALWAGATTAAAAGGFGERLGEAAAGLDFRPDHLSSLG